MSSLIRKSNYRQWRSLVELLGLVKVDQESRSYLASSLFELDASSIKLLTEQLWKEKVLLIGLENLLEIEKEYSDPKIKLFINHVMQFTETKSRFANEVIPICREEIRKVLSKHDVDFLFIKGGAVAELYSGYTRQLGDLDILVKDWHNAMQCIQTLFDCGWSLRGIEREAPWITRLDNKDLDHSNLYAHLNLVKNYGEDEVIIDLHTTTILVGMTGKLFSDVWNRMDGRSVIPTKEDNLLILIAHAATHGYFLLKDLNDAYLIISTLREKLDWDYIVECLVDSCLIYMLDYLLSNIQIHFGDISLPQCVVSEVDENKRQILARLLRRSIWLTSSAVKENLIRKEIIIGLLHTLYFEVRSYGLGSGLIKVCEFLKWQMHIRMANSKWINYPVIQFFWRKRKSLIFPTVSRGYQILLIPVECVMDDQELMEMVQQWGNEMISQKENLLSSESSNFNLVFGGNDSMLLNFQCVDVLITSFGVFLLTVNGLFDPDEVWNALRIIIGGYGKS
jgi:hypothetical protein